MSIEELLKDNNDMLKQILQQLGNNNNEGLKSKQSYIDDLPDATMSATITESENENSTNNQQGGNIKKIRLRRGVDSFKADPNKLGGDFSTRYPDDTEADENEADENEEIFEITKNEPTKIGGNKPPKVLKILSIKTNKKKSKKSKKSKKIKKSNKTKTTTKTTSNKTTSGKKTKKTLTGYQLFMKEQMPIWKKKNPKKTHKEAFGAIAKLWKLQKK
jgi:hypothetical protein